VIIKWWPLLSPSLFHHKQVYHVLVLNKKIVYKLCWSTTDHQQVMITFPTTIYSLVIIKWWPLLSPSLLHKKVYHALVPNKKNILQMLLINNWSSTTDDHFMYLKMLIGDYQVMTTLVPIYSSSKKVYHALVPKKNMFYKCWSTIDHQQPITTFHI
jgi:hypothetical protein